MSDQIRTETMNTAAVEGSDRLRIAVYNYRDFDEAQFFTKFSKEYGAELVIIRETPSVKNAALAAGCQGVTVITTAITEDIIRIWKEVGVKHISTRTIG